MITIEQGFTIWESDEESQDKAGFAMILKNELDKDT
jgi:hypothetical protein